MMVESYGNDVKRICTNISDEHSQEAPKSEDDITHKDTKQQTGCRKNIFTKQARRPVQQLTHVAYVLMN